MLFVIYGSSVFSSVFTITERSEMGLYDVPMFMSLFGFEIGMMFASFHVCGIMLLFSDVLYMLVRYASPSGPMCLRYLMLNLSGPVELLILLCFIATWTCVVVSVMLVVCSLSVFLSMCQFVLCLLCLTVLVNCLLNAFAICVGELNVFSLIVMVLGLHHLPLHQTSPTHPASSHKTDTLYTETLLFLLPPYTLYITPQVRQPRHPICIIMIPSSSIQQFHIVILQFLNPHC